MVGLPKTGSFRTQIKIDVIPLRYVFSILLIGCISSAWSQSFTLEGKVLNDVTNEPIAGAMVLVPDQKLQVETDQRGNYQLELPAGQHVIRAFYFGLAPATEKIDLKQDGKLNFFMEELVQNLEVVEVTDNSRSTIGISRLQAVDGFAIYEAKKNELIVLDDFAANKVANNARQIFAKVPGLNIWESDFAGLQLDIAARGLGPSRTANFNTRQNGYDMSADALGYPESYYLPALQAVERIEVVRGAASLQYGTQFGGMLNFKIKEAPEKPVEVNLEQAVGSFGLLNSFASVGGRNDKIDYYGYFQYRQGDGWRNNSSFDAQLGFTRLGYQPTERLKLGFEYSYLNYQAQQPGGLTDLDFQQGNLSASRRSRNWFQVSWNLLAGTIDLQFTPKTKLNIRNFGLISRRDALGNLEQISRLDDPNSNRTLISDQFRNFGTETRLIQYFDFAGLQSAVVVGGRYYKGLTDRRQGDASAAADADFSFLNPEDLEAFDYDFPSQNYAAFAENVLNLSEKFSVTPGIRFEHIRTDSEGTWKQIVRDFAGNIEAQNTFTEDRSVNRSFMLFGLGSSYYLKDDLNLYANISENFRSVTFSDLRLNNPNFLLDSMITDENGFNADLGIRGSILDWLNVDISLFFLKYNDRIGVLLPPASTLLFRTNVGDSRHIGLEAYLEADVLKLLRRSNEDTRLSVFGNLSLIDATYIRSMDAAIEGSNVEYVPSVMFRGGLNYSWKNLKASYQFSYLGEQFSDATNSVRNPSALTGLIPSYHVMDVSLEYRMDRYKMTGGINNLTDEKYFTRRAESYPGPGIIPATPRSFYLSFGVQF
ncbi:MAG: TonB-dependent receptor [Cytophagales bacterium]|nr:TonB-dependent receptor [Cytophagales bacterium]